MQDLFQGESTNRQKQSSKRTMWLEQRLKRATMGDKKEEIGGSDPINDIERHYSPQHLQ